MLIGATSFDTFNPHSCTNALCVHKNKQADCVRVFPKTITIHERTMLRCWNIVSCDVNTCAFFCRRTRHVPSFIFLGARHTRPFNLNNIHNGPTRTQRRTKAHCAHGKTCAPVNKSFEPQTKHMYPYHIMYANCYARRRRAKSDGPVLIYLRCGTKESDDDSKRNPQTHDARRRGKRVSTIESESGAGSIVSKRELSKMF